MSPLEQMAQYVRVNNASSEPLDSDDELADVLSRAHGVIHVGANLGQERKVYADYRLPVIWIEPQPYVFEALQQNIAGYRNQKAYQYLLADTNGKKYKFGVANNGCQSSSIFEFSGHKRLWPDIHWIAMLEFESRTLASVIEEHRIDQRIYDTLIIDVQGAELLVIRGAGEYIGGFKQILAEAPDFDSYKGGSQLKDIDAYLLGRGFERTRKTHIFSADGVGNYYDALYQRIA